MTPPIIRARAPKKKKKTVWLTGGRKRADQGKARVTKKKRSRPTRHRESWVKSLLVEELSDYSS